MIISNVLVLDPRMGHHHMLGVVQRAKRERQTIDSIRLQNLVLGRTLVRALIQLLLPAPANSLLLLRKSSEDANNNNHHHWDTLDIQDCAQNEHLDTLMDFCHGQKLFRHLSMQAKPRDAILRVAPPTTRFHLGLQELTIANAYLSIRHSVGIRKLLESVFQLKTLRLIAIQLERCAIVHIAQGIEANTTLQTLDCQWMSSMDAYVMMHSVSGHSSIKEIKFTGDQIPDAGSTFFGRGLNNPQCPLTTLRLNGLGEFDFAPFTSEINNSNNRLTCLDLSDNLLQNYQLGHLFSNLYKFPNLRELDLSSNCLSDFPEAILSEQVVISESLQKLNLAQNRLTDHSIDEFLTNLWKFPKLQALNLSQNRLDKLEFRNFLSNPITHRLQRLDLFHLHFSIRSEYQFSWLLKLLQNTPKHVKIDSFWGRTSSETQQLLDIRQFSVDEKQAPLSLWPHVLEQANQLLEHDESRQANAVFHIMHGPAGVSAAQDWRLRHNSSTILPTTPNVSDSEIVNDSQSEWNSSSNGSPIVKTVLQRNNNLEDTLAIAEPSSEFLTAEPSSEFSMNNESVAMANARRRKRSFLQIFRLRRRGQAPTT
jgi:hypothetical protein